MRLFLARIPTRIELDHLEHGAPDEHSIQDEHSTHQRPTAD